jgi:hypothetical protein
MRLHPTIWSLALLLTSLTGCHGASCGQTGCLGTVEVLLDHPLKQAGKYVLDVQVGAGDTVRCTVSHPRSDAACDQRWADVLTGSAGTLEGVILYRTDIETLSVSIARNGRVIGGGTYTPRYEQWFPNGPVCDDKPCQHALVEVGVVTSPNTPTGGQ